MTLSNAAWARTLRLPALWACSALMAISKLCLPSSGATSTGPLERGARERILGEFLDALRPFVGEAEVNSCERLVTLNDAIVLHSAYTSPPKMFLFGGLFDFELPEEINTNANWDYGCRGNRERHWGAAV